MMGRARGRGYTHGYTPLRERQPVPEGEGRGAAGEWCPPGSKLAVARVAADLVSKHVK
jgi:hypothetical protein